MHSKLLRNSILQAGKQKQVELCTKTSCCTNIEIMIRELKSYFQ